MNGTPPADEPSPRLFVITGICGSGKSTVARLLGERFARSVVIEGDVLRRMVVGGRAEMEPDAGWEAVAQFELRLRHLAFLAESYLHAGFTVITEDNLLGSYLERFVAQLSTRPVHVVVLAPSAAAAARRDAGRDKQAYGAEGWTAQSLDDAFRRETAEIGLWLDTSEQRPDETVEEILRRTDESALW